MSEDAAILRRVASPPRPSWLYLVVGAVSRLEKRIALAAGVPPVRQLERKVA